MKMQVSLNFALFPKYEAEKNKVEIQRITPIFIV